MKEKEITNRLCYVLIGLFLGILISILLVPKISPKQDIKVEIITKDSVKVTPKVESNNKTLNESNLKAELAKHKIPHSNIVLAQAKLETGNFKSDLVKSHQNIFGLKIGNKYRKYAHWTKCVEDYNNRISKRYTGGDYYAFLNRIGYAENPNYTKLLKDMV